MLIFSGRVLNPELAPLEEDQVDIPEETYWSADHNYDYPVYVRRAVLRFLNNAPNAPANDKKTSLL